MISLEKLVAYLDLILRTGEIEDYGNALNGIQLSNGGHIERIVAAVDSSLDVIQEASIGGPALLIVHHGMFWQGTRPIVGPIYRKLECAIRSNLAIYSSHLPLDVHPEFGNNALLAAAIGLSKVQPFFPKKGTSIGLRGKFTGTRDQLAERIQKAVGGRVHVCPGGPEQISEVGLITGGAGSEVEGIATSGVTTFVTGEGPHWCAPLARELGLNVFFGGHYATETFGVKALARHLAEKFSIEWQFIDRPTGL